MPPSGIGLERSSIVRPLVFSSICQGLPKVVIRLRMATCASGAMSPRRARWSRIWSSETPTWPISSGRSNSDAVLTVPAGEAEILVEDGDALFHLVERDLQQVAIVLQRLGRVVEQPERVLGGAVAALEQQRQDEPRRGRADRAGEQLLGEADDVHAGLLVAVQRSRSSPRRSGTSARCARRRDSARSCP